MSTPGDSLPKRDWIDGEVARLCLDVSLEQRARILRRHQRSCLRLLDRLGCIDDWDSLPGEAKDKLRYNFRDVVLDLLVYHRAFGVFVRARSAELKRLLTDEEVLDELQGLLFPETRGPSKPAAKKTPAKGKRTKRQ